MSDDRTRRRQAEVDKLLTSLRHEGEEFRSVLDGVLERTKQRWRQAKTERRPPVNAIEARIRRREFGWADVLRGESNDPDVKAAQKHIEPRIRRLQQTMFNICERDQPIDEAFDELDRQIAALRSRGHHNTGKGDNRGQGHR